MNVRELIERLQRCDPDDPVTLSGHGDVESVGRKCNSISSGGGARPRVVISSVPDPRVVMSFVPDKSAVLPIPPAS